MTVRLTRALAALLLLAGGIIHFDLWKSGYRFIPKIGPLFLANFVGSVALVITSERRRADGEVPGLPDKDVAASVDR